MAEAAAVPVPDGSVDEAPTDPGAETSALHLDPPKRLPKPDNSKYKIDIDALSKAIKAHKERNEEIKSTLDRLRKTDKTGVEETIIQEKNKAHKEFKSVKDEKFEAKRLLERLTGMQETLRGQTRDMKTQDPRIVSKEKIQAQITKLEYKQNHTSMSLNEEEKLVAQIGVCKGLLTTAATYAERMKTLQSMESDWKSASNKLENLDVKLDTLNERMSALDNDLNMARAKRRAHISNLEAELANNWEINYMAYEKIKELSRERKEANEKYSEAQRDYQAWYKWDKHKRAEARSQEEAELRAHDPADIFDEEVGYCDQLTTYLSKFTAADAKATAVGDAPKKKIPGTLDGGYKFAPTANGPQTLDGKKVLEPKGENVKRDIDYSLSDAKKKVSKKHKKGAVRKADQPGEQKQAEQKLVHSVDNLNAFAKLNIELPLTASKVPATLDAIKARKEHFLAERAKGKMESSEVVHDTPKPIGNGNIVNGHAAPGARKGAATTEVSAKCDPPLETKEAIRGKAGRKEVHIDVDDQKFPTLDAARNAKVRKGWKAQNATCST